MEVLYHRHSLYRTELDLRRMEKMGNQRIQLYVAIILFFYNHVLSQQKTKKASVRKAVNLLKENIGQLRTKEFNVCSSMNTVSVC
jgi:hypothetical protein